MPVTKDKTCEIEAEMGMIDLRTPFTASRIYRQHLKYMQLYIYYT